MSLVRRRSSTPFAATPSSLARFAASALGKRVLSQLPTPNSRKRVKVESRSGSNKKAQKNSDKRRPAGATSGTSVTNVGSSVRLARVTKREKQPAVKRPKKVRVTSTFRAKTEKVIASKKVKGVFKSEQVEAMQVGINGNVQDMALFPNNDDTIRAGQLFGLTRVLHVASRCWNEKAANQKPQVADAQNFGATTDPSTLADYAFDVTRQWWSFDLKNNTHVTLQVIVNQCSPKKQGNFDNPLVSLQKGIAFDQLNGQIISNLPGLNERTIMVNPETASTFRNQYINKQIIIVLEPGQEYSFNVSGAAMEYQGPKFFAVDKTSDANSIYQEQQKQDITLLWQVKTDMAGNWPTGEGDVVFGHTVIPQANQEQQAHKLIIKSKYQCHMLMPEQTGMNTVVTTGTTITNNLRQSVSVIDEFKDRVDLNFANRGRVDPVEPTVH